MTPSPLKPQRFIGDTGVLNVWDLPWPCVREFEIRGVVNGATRGNHAHRTCDQIIRCSAGSFFLTTQNGDDGIHGWDMGVGMAVLVPRMNWIVLSEFSPSAVATVLCSEPYSEPISNFDEFLKIGRAK